ncbi:Uncharacterised protein [Mycobacterium tuberculosis]|uniref:Uncharacterized protein n=1 Tax=Mycobacterium tuberculosis TaxID=1773 RepID=A0A916LC58_MYCTX|nr:Uncharacterised protein [Mycobacterium tuberculosis]
MAPPVRPHRNAFDVPAAQRVAAVDQSPLDHRGMRDDRPVMPDQGVHPTQRVLPVGLGEVTGKRAGDHLTDVLAGLAVKIGGVDQAGRVYLGVHSPCLPGLCYTLARQPRPGSCPVQSHILAGPYLRDLVDVLVGDDADDRIASGDRVIRPQDHR